MKRKCRECNRTKSLNLFSYRKNTCNRCFKESDAYRRQRDKYLRDTYGISIDEYEILLDVNDGRCWICYGGSNGKNLAVDHDHNTGQVRGLLCKRCNSILSRIHNRIDIAYAMGFYLEAPGEIVNARLGRIALGPDASRVDS